MSALLQSPEAKALGRRDTEVIQTKSNLNFMQPVELTLARMLFLMMIS